jgi:hypothetical protein
MLCYLFVCLALTSCTIGVVKKEIVIANEDVSTTPTPAVPATNSTVSIVTPTAAAMATPTLPSTPFPQPTATSTPSPTANPVIPAPKLNIDSFTLKAQDLPDNGKRVTFHWETTGATKVILTSGTQRRFMLWWDYLDVDGELIYDFTHSYYVNPEMRLNAYDAKGNSVTVTRTVTWPCTYTYYFDNPSTTCPYFSVTLTDGAFQQFEHGWMIWVRELEIDSETQTNLIFVFYDSGFYERYDDTWVEGQTERDPTLKPPNGLQQPIRGFGKLWRETPKVREGLGWATDQERGYPIQWQAEMRESIPGIAYLEHIDGRIIRTYNWYNGSWEIWNP